MLISSRTRCSGWHLPSRPVLALAALTFVLVLAGCKREVAQEAPPPRPVRSIVVERGGLGQSIVLTGQIQAEKEVALASVLAAASSSARSIRATASRRTRWWPNSTRRTN